MSGSEGDLLSTRLMEARRHGSDGGRGTGGHAVAGRGGLLGNGRGGPVADGVGRECAAKFTTGRYTREGDQKDS